jgi:hypothetical protein
MTSGTRECEPADRPTKRSRVSPGGRSRQVEREHGVLDRRFLWVWSGARTDHFLGPPVQPLRTSHPREPMDGGHCGRPNLVLV